MGGTELRSLKLGTSQVTASSWVTLGCFSFSVWEGVCVATASCGCHNKRLHTGGFQGPRFIPRLKLRWPQGSVPSESPWQLWPLPSAWCASVPLLSLACAHQCV